jgi:uncharacterized protein
MIFYFLFSIAFFTGLAGSLHCLGMCGPIVLALPVQGFLTFQRKIAVLLYHLGRITTYSILGMLAGYIGNGFQLIGLQQFMSVTLGFFLIISILPFEKFQLNFVMKWVFNIKQAFYKQFQKRNLSHLFRLGMLNGLLPCGTVYLSLTAAILVGNPVLASAYMLVFGLGTLPLLFMVSLAHPLIPLKIRNSFLKLTPLFTVLFGLFFILKGSNLNIPFLSPMMTNEPTKNTTLVCH